MALRPLIEKGLGRPVEVSEEEKEYWSAVHNNTGKPLVSGVLDEDFFDEVVEASYNEDNGWVFNTPNYPNNIVGWSGEVYRIPSDAELYKLTKAYLSHKGLDINNYSFNIGYQDFAEIEDTKFYRECFFAKSERHLPERATYLAPISMFGFLDHRSEEKYFYTSDDYKYIEGNRYKLHLPDNFENLFFGNVGNDPVCVDTLEIVNYSEEQIALNDDPYIFYALHSKFSNDMKEDYATLGVVFCDIDDYSFVTPYNLY